MIKKKALLTIFLLIIISFWLFYFFNKELFQLKTLFLYLDIIQNYISNNFIFSFLIFTITYCFLIICNFPFASILSLIGGFLYGTWYGGFGIVIGGTIGSFVVFKIAKLYFHDYISNKILKKYSVISDYFQKNELELMLLIRLIPGVPFFIQNLILAGLGAKSAKFFYTTLFALTPWAIVFASLGQGLEEIFLDDKKISLSMIAKPEYLIPITAIIILILFFLIFKKRLK